MFKIDKETKQINLTRGDIATIEVSALNEDGTDYTFKVGDTVRLNVFERKDYENVVIQKNVEVTLETTKVEINLTNEDTKIGDIIEKPTKYHYEVELNSETNPQTIIGYDEEGAKIFMLLPEGGDN